MKNCKKHFLVALIVLAFGQFLAPKAAHSQIIEVGGSVGLSYYMGDINPSKPLNQSQLGWGALVRFYNDTRWAFRLAYSNLQLNGSDKSSGYRPERGLSFNTNVHDVALIAEFNFLDYFTGSKRHGLSPYLFGGLSVLNFNPKADDGKALCNVLTDVNGYNQENGTPTNNIDDGTDKYSKVAVSIPFGIGVKYSLGNRIGAAIEWRWDYAFTDWLDDCHAYYPTYDNKNNPYVQYSDPTGFTDDPDHPGSNGRQYIQRGNKYDKDWYGYLNFSLVYKFVLPGGTDCNVRDKYKNY